MMEGIVEANFNLLSNLIIEHSCSLKIFNARYDRGMYLILGYDHLIEGIEDLLVGGDMDWDYCSCKLEEHDDLPIVLVLPEEDIIKGLEKIE
ncbi:hypothetical protein NE686_18135 [Tissierella carlieri]|uniref:Uncharacterized protein n=1 Tax=Tissierella carlieri TaxID=689904 RepID=A0ABT1SEW7_9FIRM|nr:hypothetical protein [Tissierella carlieri]MCQ4925026.1 hypothetical protein [Tissierella carlieri]